MHPEQRCAEADKSDGLVGGLDVVVHRNFFGSQVCSGGVAITPLIVSSLLSVSLITSGLLSLSLITSGLLSILVDLIFSTSLHRESLSFVPKCRVCVESSEPGEKL